MRPMREKKRSPACRCGPVSDIPKFDVMSRFQAATVMSGQTCTRGGRCQMRMLTIAVVGLLWDASRTCSLHSSVPSAVNSPISFTRTPLGGKIWRCSECTLFLHPSSCPLATLQHFSPSPCDFAGAPGKCRRLPTPKLRLRGGSESSGEDEDGEQERNDQFDALLKKFEKRVEELKGSSKTKNWAEDANVREVLVSSAEREWGEELATALRDTAGGEAEEEENADLTDPIALQRKLQDGWIPPKTMGQEEEEEEQRKKEEASKQAAKEEPEEERAEGWIYEDGNDEDPPGTQSCLLTHVLCNVPYCPSALRCLSTHVLCDARY
eukprot:1832176-Rhodomonas_salina.1